ncbi:hypothetical protein CC1G_03196 [Coprinopsis cinerea okayama7|uniref:Uncharacterized protein n=1 Tax=Coprinopsis cinerea (strain Okayama-7 / 130 / ATCC MYA-4618 / FGSC 9003) TaxID=240176 RepID=A8N753_COPC7|nr:hypothetical protein CC1G_03196 [Coprinopsis cinerea okayama7\|eukprot:XP_001830659.2 hypothetical protein CC1G_03196 [Coprinopsis cinerea okayama7\
MQNAGISFSSCSPAAPDGVVTIRFGLDQTLRELKIAAESSSAARFPWNTKTAATSDWQDELLPAISQHGPQVNNSPTQPTQQLASPAMSEKRHCHPDPAYETPSQKRKRIIEETLSGKMDSSPTSPDMNQRHASSTSTVPSSSFQPPSTPVRQSRSSGDKLQRFSSGTTTLDTKGRASVSDGDFGEDEWDMLTPPPSDPPRSQAEGHHHGRSVFADGGSSPSPLPRTTGKRPSTMSSSQTLLKWEDPLPSSSNLDEPYEHSNVSKKLDFSQPAHFTSQFLSDELDASMSEAFAYEQLAQCAHIFDPRLQHVLKDLPHRLEEFKKSERKRIAAEKSAEAKARRIAALEREVDELKSLVQRLESAKSRPSVQE